jgi:hypothetical protein
MLMTRVVDWPEGSRLSGMAGVPQGLWPRLFGVVCLHLVDLPDGQQGSEEMSMARAHLPFAGTSIHGTYPDGSEWMVLTQVAVVDPVQGFPTPDEAVGVLEEQFRRYQRLNSAATVVDQVVLNRLELLTGYQQSGVDLLALTDWGVDELLAGMVCEMCNIPLRDVIDGRDAGCSLPDVDHYCTGNGFTDVFAQWSRGLLARDREAPATSQVANDGELDDEARAFDALRHADREGEPQLTGDGELVKPLRHVTLEFTHGLFSGDWAVSAVWTDGALHIAHCDYGDGPDTTWGMDVDDPLALLNWMVRNRFVTNERDLIAYVRQLGISHSDWETLADEENVPSGLTVTGAADDSVIVLSRGFSTTEACTIDDGKTLTLALLRDRCQGADAWESVTDLLGRAGVISTERNRGYF